MSSQETTALLNGSGSEWPKNGSIPTNMPRQTSPRNENSPLLPPLPQSMPMPLAQTSQAHARSRSDFAFPTQSDPSHPFNRPGGGQRLPPAGNRPRSRPPSRNSLPPPASPGAIPMPPKPLTIHRRAKSDVPLLAIGGGGGTVTKTDLLKNFPNPRWGGASLNTSQHSHRKRTSSDGGFPNKPRGQVSFTVIPDERIYPGTVQHLFTTRCGCHTASANSTGAQPQPN